MSKIRVYKKARRTGENEYPVENFNYRHTSDTQYKLLQLPFQNAILTSTLSQHSIASAEVKRSVIIPEDENKREDC